MNAHRRAPLLLALAGVMALAAGPARAAGKPVLPFVRDDYAKALHEARARKVPIFIGAWAPW